jgi:aryl-alcohol dehydrogenase-like predicted oxidoreductase
MQKRKLGNSNLEVSAIRLGFVKGERTFPQEYDRLV